MLFIFKILKNNNSPQNLIKSFQYNKDLNKNYDLRNLDQLQIPRISSLNNYGESTFNFFFSKLINAFCFKELNLDFNFFKIRAKNNINIIFTKFINIFPKFDLNYSVYYCKK